MCSPLIVLWVWSHLALVAQRTTAAAPPIKIPASPIPVADFLSGLSTGQSGYSRFQLRSVTLYGQKYDQVLDTEVANTRPGEQVTTLSLLLNGAYDRFSVTVGRDDKEAGKGAGYVYFEVWGDDRLLVKSDAIGSTRSPGGISLGPEQPTRRTPQDVETSVQGILQLRLVIRYASDLPQRGRNMDHARGCLWAGARLLPASGYIGKRAGDPLRDALRIAAVRLIASTATGMAKDPAEQPRYPLTVGIAPLRLLDTEGTDAAAPEPVLRAALLELLLAAQQDRQSLFQVVERGGARLLADNFRANRPETDESAALADIGRKAGAALVVTGSYQAGQDGKVTLLATDTRTGLTTPPIEVTIASLRPSQPVRTK